MAEKSPHEIYTAALRLRGFRKDNYSDLFLKDVSENLFQKIKEFNEYYKLDSWDEVLNDDIAYNEISKHLGLKKTAYETLVKYGISEAKGERDFNFSYKKILNGINELKAELNSPDNRERWHTKEGTTELFNVKWTYLYHPDMEFVITRSQLNKSIEKLEECKKYLEIKHPDLIAPPPKDTQTPAPDEIEPPQPPKEGKQKEITPLADLITHDKSSEIIKQIKIQYKGIRGVRLRLLLMALQDLKLYPLERMDKKFHEACKLEFDWYIARYQSMAKIKNLSKVHEHELKEMKAFLKSIITPP